jgi:hypothetical protein
LFEGPRVLPEVSLLEYIKIICIVALRQPKLHIINRLNGDDTLAFEVPFKITARTWPEESKGHVTIHAFPGIVYGDVAGQEPQDWVNDGAEYAVKEPQS